MFVARKAAPAPAVYSYLRFSDPKQAEGDSRNRQRAAFDGGARTYAKTKGLAYDETLNLADEGVSAYSGAHRTKGALGRFLKLVEAGRVAPGSALFVENLDRFCREGVATSLKKIVFRLFEHNISLVTQSPFEEYGPGCEDDPKFIALWIGLTRAHEESKRKSVAIGHAKAAARDAARQGERLLTRVAPKWLRVNGAGRFEVIPEAAATVRQIFDWYLSGLGSCAIEKKLNAAAAWTPPCSVKRKSTGWRRSYIRKILTSRTTIGELQPCRRVNGRHVAEGEVLRNYYPPIIPPEIFFATQQRLAGNRGKGGRTGLARNLFGHLAVCAYCGGPMAYAHGGPRRGPGGGERASRLVCDRGRRGAGCRAHAMNYAEVETVVLSNLPGLRPEDILPQPGDQAREVQALRERLAGHEGELADVGNRVGNLNDQISRTGQAAIRDGYEKLLGELYGRQRELNDLIAEDRRHLDAAERGRQAVEEWQRDLAALTAALADGDPEVRLKTRACLRELIDMVEIFAVGHRAVYRPEDEAAAFDRVVGPAWEAARARWLRELEREYEYPPNPAAQGSLERFLRDPEYLDALERVVRDPEYLDVVCERDNVAGDIRWLAGRVGMPGAEAAAFTEYVLSRRLSREGRFVRVHFRAGVSVDLVPEGSIATGWSMAEAIRYGWTGRGTDPDNVRPNLPQLYDDWKAGRAGPQRVKPARPQLS
jgi:DNA invertase Pin-like site-specific DNA recombinase